MSTTLDARCERLWHARVKLNVGCGDESLEGWVNIDRRPVADIVADISALPIVSASVSVLRAYDVLEHFWRDRTNEILCEWRRVLCRHGNLYLRVPNMRILGAMLARGHDVEQVITNIYGGHRWGDLDTHHWGWTTGTLERDLAAAGFILKTTTDSAPNMAVWARVE